MYLLKKGSIENSGQIFWFDDMLFSSYRKARKYIDQGYYINQGYDYKESQPWFNDDIYITYKCLSSDSENSVEMTVNFQLKKMTVL